MWQLPSTIHLSLVLKAICTIRFSPGKDLYMEQRGTAGTFISNVQKAQKQHPSLHSLPPPREDGGLQGKENTETTSWSLGHGQRKLVEIFQLGNRSSQAIKCFTQTRSLTTLGAPCSISHTARLAPYKIKASDHKHKKRVMLCHSAFPALQQASTTRRNRVCPHFLQEEASTSRNPTLQPWQKWPLHSERSPGHLSQRKIFGRALCSPVAEPCPGCLAHLAFQLWVLCFLFLEGLGVGEPRPCLLWTL